MTISRLLAFFTAAVSLSVAACQRGEEEAHAEEHTIVVTTPLYKEVTVTTPYVCQIHSSRHIEIRALKQGYLEQINVKEGQAVKEGEVLFKVIPLSYKAKIAAAEGEVQYAKAQLESTQQLYDKKVVAQFQVNFERAKLLKAQGELREAEAELYFTEVRAQFDGIIDRQMLQQGSLVKEGDVLTTLSDNSLMWVYFNVPEARYLGYMRNGTKRIGGTNRESRYELLDSQIELKLADGSIFNYSAGNTVTIESLFNNQTGNIKFRADFPNSQGLLRHGEVGTVLIHHKLKNALVIPQRATFEFLDKQYVWVIGEDHKAHQRLITVQNELEDVFIVKSGHETKNDVITGGLDDTDKIIFEGVRQVREGDEVKEFEFIKPEEALKDQKSHAE